MVDTTLSLLPEHFALLLNKQFCYIGSCNYVLSWISELVLIDDLVLSIPYNLE